MKPEAEAELQVYTALLAWKKGVATSQEAMDAVWVFARASRECPDCWIGQRCRHIAAQLGGA